MDGFDEWAEATNGYERATFLALEYAYRLGFTTMTALAGFQEMPYRPAQFIAWIGWAAFLLLVLSAYTANLAAHLGQVGVWGGGRTARKTRTARACHRRAPTLQHPHTLPTKRAQRRFPNTCIIHDLYVFSFSRPCMRVAGHRGRVLPRHVGGDCGARPRLRGHCDDVGDGLPMAGDQPRGD